MNAFYEHHKDSIRFGYRCFDWILLNGLIQPFQQPERVVGFFATYRHLYPVSRDVLRGAAEQFQCWVKDQPTHGTHTARIAKVGNSHHLPPERTVEAFGNSPKDNADTPAYPG
jgi:hypothetical protein